MNKVHFTRTMVQINKRTELAKLVDSFKKDIIFEYPELTDDTPQNAGKVFELFLCREIYKSLFQR